MRAIVFIFLLLCKMSLFAKYNLAVCAIFKNEARWLKEWIEFHKLQGVQHFYLYNNDSEDDYLSVLKPYIESKRVTLLQWNYEYDMNEHREWLQIQTGAYMDCIERFKEKASWLAFIDIDEFLFCVDGRPLPEFLKDYQEYGGVAANWRLFGTSFVKDIPPETLMIEMLTRCSNRKLSRNDLVKSIVQPKYVKDCRTAHYFIYKEGKYDVTEHFERNPGRNGPISHDKICINHYWTRTENHFRTYKMGSRYYRRNHERFELLQRMADQYNVTIDEKILQFVPALRKKMGFED